MFKISEHTLADVAQWIELWLAKQKLDGLVPSQKAPAWVAGQVPSWGQEATSCFSHKSMFLFLTL